jgi:vitamin B12 transporter
MSKISYLVLSLFLANGARAEDGAPPLVTAPEIVVTGKRLHGDHRSARVYTETELANEAGRPIGDVLRGEAGVDYIEGTGGNSNLLIRGSSGSQTLVIIDGVKANDPSATNRYFDWSRIDASQIERIEILKGPQAVAYGSDAIGGVVLITTKHSEATPGGVTSTASLEGGSEAFFRARGSVGKDLGHVLGGDHSLSVEAIGKGVFDGGSQALSPTGGPLEGDNSREAQAGFALKSRWGRETHTALVANIRAAQEDIDGGAFDDDPNSVARNREIRASATADGTLTEGVEWGAVVSHLDFRRAYSDTPDAANPTSSSDTVLRGTNSRGEVHVRSAADAFVDWSGGFEATHETIHVDSLLFPTTLTRTEDSTYGVFGEGAIPLVPSRVLTADFGARYSHFDTYGNQWSEKGGLNYRPFDFIEFDAGISTGFKAPSLYSLYDPNYGNPNLKPEESTQVEAGAIVRPSRTTLISVRGFTSQVKNRFGYDPVTFRSLNVEHAEIRGVELESETRLIRNLRFSPSLTYLSTKDFHTGRPLNDVPRWKGALKLAYDFSRTDVVTLSVVAKSDRGSSAGSGHVAGFYRVDLTSRHRLSADWTLTTRLENLLDRDYQEIYGYRTAGVSGYLGLEFASL